MKGNELINYVKEISDKIKNLEIRGATTIAIKAVETIKFIAQNAPDNELERILVESLNILKNSRMIYLTINIQEEK